MSSARQVKTIYFIYMGLFSTNKSFLGIDIGTSSIKIVELKGEAGKIKLLTYGFSENILESGQVDIKDIVYIINKICDQAGTVSRSAVSALPTFSVFSSILNLSGVSKKDIASAVHWEAKKVIPLPLEEMILDWKKIEDKEEKSGGKTNIRVLLTGAPRALVKRYIDIFKNAQINLISLETESFALIRSLLGNDKSTVMIVEIGATTTSITIISQSIPIFNRSIDIGGLTITKAISNNLNIGLERAEQFKYDLGISHRESQEEIIPKTITETISPIINEIKYSLTLFQSKSNKTVDKIILSGGSALLINFPYYLSKILNINVIVGNPWPRISYPSDLKLLLDEIGPRLAIAIGLAMREIE